ncbi:MAG: alanine racemase [Burkholderiales bacterium]|jgi:alanine racemase|nr:alanine racemase [Burkholderiales bacterium]
MPRPITATIDVSALAHNLEVARAHAPHAKVFAVIKANAYGHGLLRAAQALRAADGFAVVEFDAAVRLREAGFAQRILLLEGFFDGREMAEGAARRIAAVVHRRGQIAMLGGLPAGARLDVLLKVNSGMNRLGFAPEEFRGAYAALQDCPGVGKVTLMTHFADADAARGVDWQMETFERAAAGIAAPRSLANSAATLRHPQTHFDWVRPGIMLYGSSPFAEVPAAALGLRPAMTLRSEIIAVCELRPGDTVGYGGLFRAERPMRIGIVACGYADGYPRHAPNGTPVRVGDRLSGTVGRVSMDKLCVDISTLPGAGVGTPVVLWGEGNPVDDVAQAAGTVGYELLCALAARVPVIEQS